LTVEKKSATFFLLLLLLSFISFGVILSLPFLQFRLPGGSDTPVYFLYARITREDGVSYLLQSDRPLTIAFVTITNTFTSALNMSTPEFLLFTQLVLGLLYIVAIFFIVLVATENRWVAVLSSILAATSANTLRFQPLMANFFALSFAIYSVAFLMVYRKSLKKKYLALTFVFLLLSFFAHPWQTIFFAILLFSASFLYLVISHGEDRKLRMRRLKFVMIAVALLVVFLSSWFLLWPSSFSDLTRRFGQIFGSFFAISPETFLRSASNWIVFETWVLKLTGLAGIVYARAFIKNKFNLIFFYLWFVLPLVGSTFLLFGDDSMRFFIIAPFAVFSSFFLTRIAIFIQESNLRPLINYRAIKLHKRNLSFLVVFAILTVNFFEACSWQSRYLTPTITWHDYERLLSAQKRIGNYSIIPIYPVKDAGAWAEAILGSTSKKIFVYNGKIENLIKDKGPISDSWLPYSVKFLEENYTVVVFDKLYTPYIVIRQILKEFGEEGIFYIPIRNQSEYFLVNDFLAKIGNIKIAVVGSEADVVARVVYDLDLSCEYLGNSDAALPNIEQLLKYDLMILADWNISSRDDFLKLYTYSTQKPIMALSTSAYNLFKYNNTFFETTFGAKLAVYPNSTYDRIVYFDNSTFFTSHLATPYTRELWSSSPVANLTTARGLARVNDNEYYLLTFNQHSDFCNAFFGRSLRDMDENETFLLEKLIVWILNL